MWAGSNSATPKKVNLFILFLSPNLYKGIQELVSLFLYALKYFTSKTDVKKLPNRFTREIYFQNGYGSVYSKIRLPLLGNGTKLSQNGNI